MGSGNREHRLFDEGWRFHLGDVQSGERPRLDDSSWRAVDLPHDWSIEDLTGSSMGRTRGPFDPAAVGGRSTGFTVGGIGWYRKRFTLPAKLKGRRVHVRFDGVYMNADVWINGTHLGNHPYGYTSFWYDFTPYLRFGGENVLVVRVKNEGKNTRWYSGSGIYRHVWLTVTGPIHVAHWGTYVTTPRVSRDSADVRVRTRVRNETREEREVTLRTRIVGARGKAGAWGEARLTVQAGAEAEFDQIVAVQNLKLWSPEKPALHAAVSEVIVGRRVVDRAETVFGIRSISFDAKNGCLLNGKPVLLKGGCMHHDNGCLGAATYDRAEERRVRLMKDNGFNAIRTSHNPPSPAFLDACDRLGMFVIDEAFDHWEWPKNDQDYHRHFKEWWKRDIESMVLRDRNHPSVIMWSIGNEIPERGTEVGIRNGKMLAEHVRSLDPTRPVTEAVCGAKFRWEQFDPYFANLDVCGYNYKQGKYRPDHERVPSRVMYAAESFPMHAYDFWMAVLDQPWVVGDFVWTGYDYLGEAGIGWWSFAKEPKEIFPWTVAYCGDLDLCGFKRPQSYYRDVLWKTGRKVSMFVRSPEPRFGPRESILWGWDDVHARWNWPGHEGKILNVDVYSACERVRLLLNGRNLGVKNTSRKSRFKASWKVPYEPGVLKAVGYDGGRKVATWELRTAGKPAKLKLSVDRKTLAADGQDLCFVTVEVRDARGIRHPTAENLIWFRIEGAGSIAGVGSGNPVSVESFQRSQRRAFEGRCLVVVKSGRSPGRVRLTAEADGLRSDSVALSVQ